MNFRALWVCAQSPFHTFAACACTVRPHTLRKREPLGGVDVPPLELLVAALLAHLADARYCGRSDAAARMGRSGAPHQLHHAGEGGGAAADQDAVRGAGVELGGRRRPGLHSGRGGPHRAVQRRRRRSRRVGRGRGGGVRTGSLGRKRVLPVGSSPAVGAGLPGCCSGGKGRR